MPIIVLYHRRFPVKGSPTSISLLPFPTSQIHTFTVGATVYPATFHESRVQVPADSTIDNLKNVLCWSNANGKFKSTATEVLGFAKAKSSGFQVHRGK